MDKRYIDLLIMGVQPNNFTERIEKITRNYDGIGELFQLGAPREGVNPEAQKLGFGNNIPMTFGDWDDEHALINRIGMADHPAVIVFTDSSEKSKEYVKRARHIAACTGAQYRELDSRRQYVPGVRA